MSNVLQNNPTFSGIIGQEYDLLRLICPLATKMSELVGEAILSSSQHLSIIELGGGTGITTLAMLLANSNVSILSIDNAETMQNQAKNSLNPWVEQGRLHFLLDDALIALKNIPSNSVDIIASAYTLHNFEASYRYQVYQEILRILRIEGQFVNGDRYGLNDVSAHTATLQKEISHYFNVLVKLGKLDVLEHWITHVFNDESENHVMREAVAIQQLHEIGFKNITLSERQELNALLIAEK